MIKAICIKGYKYNGIRHLTIGNIYDLEDMSIIDELATSEYSTITDNNDTMFFSMEKTFFYVWNYFKLLADWRNEQINSILED